MTRFPFGFPDGWFAVAFSDELAPSAVHRVRSFDRELVLFRTERGEVAAIDGYCPHLGAHLGEGGKVVGETLECPLHGWRYATSGECVGVPYAPGTPPAAVRAHPWHVRERNGVVLVWHHGGRTTPDYEIPSLPEWGSDDWTTIYQRREWRVRTHPQEVVESAIDWPHYGRVHAMAAPEERDHSFADREFTWTIGASTLLDNLDDRRPNYLIEARHWGLGLGWARYSGLYKTIAFTGLTPIDHDTIALRLGVFGKRDGRGDEQTRAALCSYLAEQAAAMEQDIRIWENKCYRAEPPLRDEDGPIREFRRWAERFYSGAGRPLRP